ncbi:hypothetical protein MES5069_230038 [Mesorhizobium escarrei]|uniref:Uncharacterized protein n=1 Tax=Mesorhizobium escarrei TaxID=666018 RepID=A0ABN8JNI2_9HYPH|nr:hypothetical protein MES5069_230038 [Mesorhizobium escarrei]
MDCPAVVHRRHAPTAAPQAGGIEPMPMMTAEERKAARLETQRRYREKNRERIREAGREWARSYREANPGRGLEAARERSRHYRAAVAYPFDELPRRHHLPRLRDVGDRRRPESLRLRHP